MPSSRDSRPVYSTDTGRLCPDCAQPVAQCRCQALALAAARPVGDGIVRVSREVSGRGGKVVTVVRGLPGSDAELAATAKALKAACGSGGTLKDGVLEIQGEQRDKVVAWLQGRGLTVRRAGG
jgi:translation initiation factor 1